MNHLDISRRSFLKLIGGAALLGVAAPAMQVHRAPYVTVGGGAVSYIGAGGGRSFTGAKSVFAVHPFDGVGYPVDLCNGAYGRHAAIVRYYDFDLCDFNKEVPMDFWHEEGNRRKYNNIHTWVREQRFGETIAEAVYHLGLTPAGVPV